MNSVDLSQLPCQHLKGVGKSISEKLARLGIQTIQDLLFHLPLRYQDRTRIHLIRELMIHDHVVIEGVITSVTYPKVGRTRLLCQLTDASGKLNVRFFYVNAMQRTQLQVGVKVRCYGEVRRGVSGLEMIHPEYHLIHLETPLPTEETLTPIYPATEGLSQFTFRKLTHQALQLLQMGSVLQDTLPQTLLDQFSFPSLKEALQFVHRPPSHASLDILHEKKHVSQKRLVFEELLAHRLSLLKLKNTFQVNQAFSLEKKEALSLAFLQQLSFKLTASQKKVIDEIAQDLTKPYPMLRLVQGDVGSGKTVVAAMAVLQAIENHCQAAILAPTELLAEQHYRTFQKWFSGLGVSVVLLTGQLKTKERSAVTNAIESGEAKIVIGTHALFQKGITFSKLALIVVDEQHRFGVHQRALLREKGAHGACFPHQLVMTATPIPRTLAMSAYADLDCSVINELPPGRTPVSTIVIANSRREEVLTRIREACLEGRQAYWVCTLIEESEHLQCEAAEATAKLLNEILPELKMGLIHGRMSSQEKEKVMSEFKKGSLQLLVATTVIEVGVDVPNASLMVIENAERLGLAQLHQLRGRVGRGSTASHCVLMYQMPLSQLAKERLKIMRETTDGFKIADRDLQLRGPGEVLGTRQTGDMQLRIADLVRDSDLLTSVQKAAELLQESDETVSLLIHRWLGQRQQYGHV